MSLTQGGSFLISLDHIHIHNECIQKLVSKWFFLFFCFSENLFWGVVKHIRLTRTTFIDFGQVANSIGNISCRFIEYLKYCYRFCTEYHDKKYHCESHNPPSICKAKWKTNETIFFLILGFIQTRCLLPFPPI